jgi:O-antigen/teichoic acid export membrane protein
MTMRRRTARVRAHARRRIRAAGPFLKPVVTLVGGTAAAQALVFAARPVLTRLFSPESFGVLTVFVTLVGIAPAFATGRYDDAILLPKRDKDAAALLGLALGLATLSALLLALLLPFRDAVAWAMGEPAAGTALVLVPATALLCAGGLALETWHTRFGRFRLLSGARLAQSTVVVGVQLGTGALAAAGVVVEDGTLLVVGAALGFVVLFAALGLPAVRKVRRLGGAAWADVRRLARRYGRFPRFTAPAALLNTLGSRAPVLLLAAFFGSGAVGQFGVAFGALALPLGVLTGAVGQVYGRDGAEAVRAGRLGPLALQVTRGLVAVAVYPALAVAATGPALFAFVFGEVWTEAGRYAQAVAVWAALAAVAVPLTRTFDLAERQKADLAFSVAMGAVLIGVLGVAAQHLDALGTVAAAGVAGAAMRLMHIGWMLRIAGAPLGPAVRYALWAVLVGAACALAPAAALWMGWTGIGLLVALVIGGFLYAALVVRREL